MGLVPSRLTRGITEGFDEHDHYICYGPSRSTNLNPVEHLWESLDRHVGTVLSTTVNILKTQMREYLLDCHPSSRVQRLVKSMPDGSTSPRHLFCFYIYIYLHTHCSILLVSYVLLQVSSLVHGNR